MFMNSDGTLCVFIHFDSNDLYSDEDLHYIKTLSEIFKSVVVLTSNTKEIPLIPNVHTITSMSNVGFDFGKLETYINTLDLDNYDELYVFNNSCYLVRDPSVSLEFMKTKGFDFWGYTSSQEQAIHVQSYFLYFSRAALQFLKNFLTEYSPTKNNYTHLEVVRRLELPLVHYLSGRKMKCGVYLETHKLFGQSNPTILHADKLLILNPHYPFIKKKVFTEAKSFTKEYLFGVSNTSNFI